VTANQLTVMEVEL